MDSTIGTYICTYDFTETALNSLVKVLYGELSPTGSLPGTISKSQKLHHSRLHWLVETFNEERDANALDTLVTAVMDGTPPNQRSELSSATSNSFILHQCVLILSMCIRTRFDNLITMPLPVRRLDDLDA